MFAEGSTRKTLGIKMDETDYRALQAIAKANHRVVSAEARKVLCEYIRSRAMPAPAEARAG
jgi:hypothetical protein